MDHGYHSQVSNTNGVSSTECSNNKSTNTIDITEMKQVHLSLTVKHSPEICNKDIKPSPITHDDIVECYNGLVSEFKGCIVINYNILTFEMVLNSLLGVC